MEIRPKPSKKGPCLPVHPSSIVSWCNTDVLLSYVAAFCPENLYYASLVLRVCSLLVGHVAPGLIRLSLYPPTAHKDTRSSASSEILVKGKMQRAGHAGNAWTSHHIPNATITCNLEPSTTDSKPQVPKQQPSSPNHRTRTMHPLSLTTQISSDPQTQTMPPSVSRSQTFNRSFFFPVPGTF